MNNKKKYSLKKANLWRSDINVDFYETLPLETLLEASESAGLNTYCDLKLIDSYINNASSILEIGPGYGRVIDYILSKKYKGKIYAIERSKNFFSYLQQKFSTQVELINADIMNYSFTKKFDVILWLWSGFIEFSIEEQKSLFVKLSSLLNPEGVIIIDVIPLSFQPPHSKLIDEQHYNVYLPPTKIPCYCYVPSIYDFFLYAALSSLDYIQTSLYITPTNRRRLLHVFTK